MEKLIAIDGNSLMHRAYYALPSMTSKTGTPTGAVYGFIGMLLKLLQYEPDYMLVAFDMHGPTFRHAMYSAYKAGRKETPEDLRMQFPLIKTLLSDMHITVCECESFEADDILGTFACMANENGVDALLVTGDRDALQLIGPHTHVLMTKKGISETVEYDEAVLLEEYGLTPGRMIDLKGLMGDGSDNIPGIPGVGEKTALKLLEKYSSLEAVLQNAQNEKGVLQKKLMENGDLARTSYQLGIIDRHAPLDISLADCRFTPARMADAIPLMNTLELRSLITRLPKGNETNAVPAPDVETETIRIADAAALSALTETFCNISRIAIHASETLTLSVMPQKQYEIALGATLFETGLAMEEVFEALRGIFEDEGIEKYVFGAKHLMHLLSRQNIRLCNLGFDAMIADYLLHAIHPADSLETLSRERLSRKGDAATLLLLAEEMGAELREKGLDGLYRDMEMPLTHVLFSMEKCGFAVDPDVLSSLGEQFGARIGEIEGEIYALAGEEFNILSPKQLGTVLFDKMGLPAKKKTKSGYSTDAEALETISEANPIVPLVLEYRFLSKLKSTFVDALIEKARRNDGRIHTTFNQNVTATGRISSTEPNLQNIPVRTALGREIRKAFVASQGHLLVGADYSQIELRLLAHMSGDAGLIKAFNAGADIHASTAAEVFGVPLELVSAEMRSAAKAVNFGIVYGISDFGLAKNIGVSRKEAAAYIERYFERYPGVKAYMEQSVAQGKAQGYVTTLLGRRRELPELRASNYTTRAFGERVAMNMPIQGTAADVIKIAMVRVHKALAAEGLRTKLILQVHDELILDAPEAEAEKASALLLNCMQNVLQLSVPLVAEVRTGKSWYETK